ncbi:hypothetical protein SFRURICE_016519 [Spodoptera frugiperda]|nr:hypothetical protein SFRURICE_016519 [Spodoptera frugiperda]
MAVWITLNVKQTRTKDRVEHTMAVCPAWAEHRQVLRDVVGDGDLSRPALVQAMVRSERDWDAVSSLASKLRRRRGAAGLRTASKGSSPPEQIQTRACGASRSARASKSHQTTTDGAQQG